MNFCAFLRQNLLMCTLSQNLCDHTLPICEDVFLFNSYTASINSMGTKLIKIKMNITRTEKEELCRLAIYNECL